jgi:hypothetical protein
MAEKDNGIESWVHEQDVLGMRGKIPARLKSPPHNRGNFRTPLTNTISYLSLLEVYWKSNRLEYEENVVSRATSFPSRAKSSDAPDRYSAKSFRGNF